MSTRPSSLTILASIIVSLLIGGIGGYYVRSLSASPANAAPAPGGRRGGGGGMGGMMGGMGGRGGGQASNATALPRLVRNLALIEKVQNQGVSAEQAKKLLPIMQQLQSANKLSEQDCTSQMAAINAVLTDAQKQALQDLQPQRGGGGFGGGGGGFGGPGGGMGGPPGMGGRGGGQDPEHPFASDRNKQALADLSAALQQPQKQ